MAHSNQRHVFVVVAVAVAAFLAMGEASGVGLNFHHRSSPVVRQWAEARGHLSLSAPWPAHGSPEYYSELSRHDRAHLARRSLAGADGLLSFADGNDTRFRSDLGYSYFAEVAVGTPPTTFLVALGTGSELFWVPCGAPANATAQGEAELRRYSPRMSSTSKTVPCGHTLCYQPCARAGNGSSCPYTLGDSSGVLVEDVLHLTREGPGGAAVKAPVVFGCAQEHTGHFFQGTLGLGMNKISVPSVLASSGLVASDSFSMCFSHDGVGRINFGDAGSRGQDETRFIVDSAQATYNVSFTSINVGRKSTPVELTAAMVSDVALTYLRDPAYTAITTNFHSLILEKRATFPVSANLDHFEYCYELSPGQTEVVMPEVSLTTKEGAVFPITRPFFFLQDGLHPFGFTDEINGQGRRPHGYCLAILKSDDDRDIIGNNFMAGLKVVFDRERSVLGWQKFDCYKNAKATDDPDGRPGVSVVALPEGDKKGKAADGLDWSPSDAPRQNSARADNNDYPSVWPRSRSAASGSATAALGGLSSLLLALLSAALV
ncbi:hypothetical protein ACP70R_043683 [Stipagrostis hirtigluma subsp. patula]